MALADAGACRLCLGRAGGARAAGAALRVRGRLVRPADILASFYNYTVTPDDGLPQNICLACINQLTMTYSFNILIQDTWEKLSKAEFSEPYCDRFNDDDFESDNDIKPLIKLRKDTSEELNEPLTISNDMKSTSVYCVECRKLFDSTKKLIHHCKTHHKPKSKIGRECDFCNEKFEDFRSLIIHRKYHFSLYVCDVCWHGFNSHENLESHNCQKKSDSQKEVKKREPDKVLRQCDQCGKSYPPSYIKMHMLIHSEQRLYSCKYCPKKFKVPCGLNSHILWNHMRTRNHKCDICNAMFISASSKSSHVRKHHLKEKKHMCENCGKKFFSKSEIQRHMLTHSGVKNFHCHMCDKSYQTRYGLNLHLKSHSISV